MEKPRLVILGAGGHGRVVAEIAALSGYREICFADQRFPALAKNLIWPVSAASLDGFEESTHCFVAVGDCRVRRRQVEFLLAAGRTLPVLVHPRAAVSALAAVGPGTVIMAQAAVNPGTEIGKAVIVNTGATLDHDCRIGDGVHISPGANLAGGVSVGAETWIGIGTVVRELISIGSGATIGAGSVVLSPVPDDAKVFGVPARPRE